MMMYLMTYFVLAWSYESIVPEVPTDVCRDDFSVDTVFWDEILISTGSGCYIASVALSFSFSGGHGWKSDGKWLIRRKKGQPETKEG